MAKNPILRNKEVAERFEAMPDEAQSALKDFSGWLYEYAREKADHCWEKSKAPMAVYWKAVAAWAYHIKRFL